MIAGADETSLADEDRRAIDQGRANEACYISQFVQIGIQGAQVSRPGAAQEGLDLRNACQRAAQGHHVAGVGIAKTDATHQAFYIVQSAKKLAQIGAEEGPALLPGQRVLGFGL